MLKLSQIVETQALKFYHRLNKIREEHIHQRVECIRGGQIYKEFKFYEINKNRRRNRKYPLI